MVKGNSFHKKKARKAESHRRAKAKRAPYERILVVCEGAKTEPNYFRGLRQALGLHPMNIVIADRKHGLDPMGLVEYTLEEYKKDPDFNHVYCVFDRDKHLTYDAALNRIRTIRLKNRTAIHAITSVPCFEIWLLLHFTYTTRPFCAACDDSNADLVIAELSKYLPDYEKGAKDIFIGNEPLRIAVLRARQLEVFHETSGTDNPSTQVHRLVEYVKGLKR